MPSSVRQFLPHYAAYLLLLFIASTIGLTFCSASDTSPSESQQDRIETNGPVPAFITHNRKDEKHNEWSYHFQYPEFGLYFIDQAIQTYLHEEITHIPQMLADGSAHIQSAGANFSLSCSMSAPSPEYVSVCFSYWEAGTSHRSFFHLYGMTFSLQEGRLISLKDLFTSWKSAQPQLAGMVHDRFSHSEECKSLVTEANTMGLLAPAPDTYHFLLDPDGLTLLYDHGSPAYWACSTIELDKESLIRIGAKKSIWAPSTTHKPLHTK